MLSKQNDVKSKPDEKNNGSLGYLDIAKLTYQIDIPKFISDTRVSINKIKDIVANAQEFIELFNKIATVIVNELNEMEKSSDNKKAPSNLKVNWENFLKNLQACGKIAERVGKEFDKKTLDAKSLAVNLNQLIKQIADFLTSVDDLGFNSDLLKFLPNLDDIKKQWSVLYLYFINMFNLRQMFDDFYSSNFVSDPEEFSKLPKMKKVVQLYLAKLANDAFRAMYVFIDEYSLKFSIPENYAVDRRLDFLSEKSFLHTLKLSQIFQDFCSVYERNMKNSGYALESETYPYTQAVLKNNRIMLLAVNEEISKFKPDAKITEKEKLNHQALLLLKEKLEKRISQAGPQLLDMKHSVNVVSIEKQAQTITDIINYYMESSNKLSQQFKSIVNDLISPESEEKAAESISIDQRIKQYEMGIKEFLDDEVYKKLFQENEAKYDEKSMSWIEEMAICFNSIKMSVSLFDDGINKESSGLKKLSEEILQPADTAIKIANEVKKITQSINHLRKNAFLNQFSSITGLKEFVLTTTAAVRSHSITKSLSLDTDKISGLGDLLEQLQDAHAELIKFSADTTETRNSVIKLTEHTKILMKKFNDLNHDELEPVTIAQYFMFIVSNFGTIKQIYSDFMPAFNYIKLFSIDTALNLAHHFNHFLKDLFLMIDKLETQFYLKEGSIMERCKISDISLYQLTQKFNTTMESHGYELNDSFPYAQSILKQRLAIAETAKDIFEKEFLQRRVAEAKKTAMKFAGPTIKLIKKMVIKKEIIRVIDEQINCLETHNSPTEKAFISLRNAYLPQGNGYYEAIALLNATNKSAYDLLVKNEKEFLLRLRNMDREIPNILKDLKSSSAPNQYRYFSKTKKERLNEQDYSASCSFIADIAGSSL